MLLKVCRTKQRLGIEAYLVSTPNKWVVLVPDSGSPELFQLVSPKLFVPPCLHKKNFNKGSNTALSPEQDLDCPCVYLTWSSCLLFLVKTYLSQSPRAGLKHCCNVANDVLIAITLLILISPLN